MRIDCKSLPNKKKRRNIYPVSISIYELSASDYTLSSEYVCTSVSRLYLFIYIYLIISDIFDGLQRQVLVTYLPILYESSTDIC